MTKERNTIPGIMGDELSRIPQEQIIAQPVVTEESNNLAEIDSEPSAYADQQMPNAALKMAKPAERRGFKYLLIDVLTVVVSAVIIAAVLKTFVLDSRIVPTESMFPTIHGGDRVIILKLPYYFGKTPARLDVVVFAAPEEFESDENLLKRVIGLPGDTVEVKNRKVYVNGEALIEPYLNAEPLKDYEKVTVPADCYFMMGDNRNHSRDSPTNCIRDTPTKCIRDTPTNCIRDTPTKCIRDTPTKLLSNSVMHNPLTV